MAALRFAFAELDEPVLRCCVLACCCSVFELFRSVTPPPAVLCLYRQPTAADGERRLPAVAVCLVAFSSPQTLFLRVSRIVQRRSAVLRSFGRTVKESAVIKFCASI